MLKPSVYRARWYIPVIVFFVLAESILSIFEPYIFGSVVDSIISLTDQHASITTALNSLSTLLFSWLIIFVFITIFGALQLYYSWKSSNLQIMNFLQRVTEKIFQLDIRRFETSQAGTILKKINKAWDGYWRLHDFFMLKLMRSVFLFISATIIGFIVDWRLALVSFLPIPFIIGIGLFNLRRSETVQDKIDSKWESINGYIGDSIANIAAIKTFVKEKVRVLNITRIYRSAFKDQMRVNRSWSLAYAGYDGIYTAGRLLIFLVGAILIIDGSMTVGTLVMFLGFLNFMFHSVHLIVDQLPYLSEAFSRMNRLADLWYEVPEIQDRDGAKKADKIKGDVEFKNVEFSYNDGKRVLRDVSFTIEVGKTFALIGESGAGKSTLAKMMLRFHDPQSGQILIDHKDIRDIKLASLRKNVGFVMQENMLFHETILNNIKLAKPGATQKEIETAAKRAQAHDFIMKLPKGYNTVVGERGVKLSGGEKQRIAIARVFLEDPPILVLDEATSALDSKTEHDLQEALREVMKNRTTLVIAHRLSTVMSADQILVMDKGKIVDAGTHSELIVRDSLYRDYWQIQACNYV